MKTLLLIAVLVPGCAAMIQDSKDKETAVPRSERLDDEHRSRAGQCYRRATTGSAIAQAMHVLGAGLRRNDTTAECTTDYFGKTTCIVHNPPAPSAPPPVTYETVCYDSDGNELQP